MSEIDYHDPDFDANASLRVADLRRILIENDIDFPSSAKKSVLVDLFNRFIKTESQEAGTTKKIIKPSSKGIEKVEQENVNPSRSKSPRKKIPKKRSEANMSAEIQEGSLDLPVPLEPRSPMRARKSAASSVKEEKTEDDSFSSDNPFQRNSTPSGDRTSAERRKTAGGSKSKVKSEERHGTHLEKRRKSQPAYTLQQTPDDSAARRTTQQFMSPMNEFKTSPEFAKVMRESKGKQSETNGVYATEEFTPEASKELMAEGSPKYQVLTASKSPSSATSLTLWGVVMTLLSVYLGWWRTEKIALGYCGLDSDMRLNQGYGFRQIFRPHCEPCPPHALCAKGYSAVCEEEYIYVDHPLAQRKYVHNGFIPLPPSCRADTEKQRRITIFSDEAQEMLRTSKADDVCATSGSYQDQGTGMTGEEIRTKLHDLKSPSISEEHFEELWTLAAEDLTSREEITIDDEKKHRNARHFYSKSLAKVPFRCFIRYKISGSLARYRITIIGMISALVSLAYLQRTRTYRRTDQKRVSELVKTILRHLVQQKRVHSKDPGRIQSSSVGISQLRDVILQDEFNPTQRHRLWSGVQKIVEGNSNIRARQMEFQGEIMRVWEWVGSISDVETGPSNRPVFM